MIWLFVRNPPISSARFSGSRSLQKSKASPIKICFPSPIKICAYVLVQRERTRFIQFLANAIVGSDFAIRRINARSVLF